MVRDFSQGNLEKLKGLISEIEDEKWCDFTDSLGDWWYGTIFYSRVTSEWESIQEYHKKVLDRENTSAQDLERIFSDVIQVEKSYQPRLAACNVRMSNLISLQNVLAQIISPKNAFTPQQMSALLAAASTNFAKQEKVLDHLMTDGVSLEDAKLGEDNQAMLDTLRRVGNVMMLTIPELKGKGRIEIPIGPDVTFYYEVEVAGNKDALTEVEIETEINAQRLEFGGVEVGGSILGLGYSQDSDGARKFSISGDNCETTFNLDGGVEYESSVTINGRTYTVHVEAALDSVSAEQSVEVEINDASITSTIGLRKDNSDNGWRPVPVPVPVYVESPSPISIPSFDVDWEDVAIVGGTVIVIVGIGAVIYFTGGAAAPLLLAV